MTREDVIKGFRLCTQSDRTGVCPDDCPYADVDEDEDRCITQVKLDVMKLLESDKTLIETQALMINDLGYKLKEQKAVEPIPPTDESDLWKCGNCNHQLFRCTHQRYCEMCGRSVKWE